MTMLGYQNNVLRINLKEKTASTEPLRMDFARKYIGSKGLAIRYMYEELEPGIDALGEKNKLFLTTGPLTGTPVPCSGKLSVAAKSPATLRTFLCAYAASCALVEIYADIFSLGYRACRTVLRTYAAKYAEMISVPQLTLIVICLYGYPRFRRYVFALLIGGTDLRTQLTAYAFNFIELKSFHFLLLPDSQTTTYDPEF